MPNAMDLSTSYATQSLLLTDNHPQRTIEPTMFDANSISNTEVSSNVPQFRHRSSISTPPVFVNQKQRTTDLEGKIIPIKDRILTAIRRHKYFKYMKHTISRLQWKQFSRRVNPYLRRLDWNNYKTYLKYYHSEIQMISRALFALVIIILFAVIIRNFMTKPTSVVLTKDRLLSEPSFLDTLPIPSQIIPYIDRDFEENKVSDIGHVLEQHASEDINFRCSSASDHGYFYSHILLLTKASYPNESLIHLINPIIKDKSIEMTNIEVNSNNVKTKRNFSKTINVVFYDLHHKQHTIGLFGPDAYCVQYYLN